MQPVQSLSIHQPKHLQLRFFMSWNNNKSHELLHRISSAFMATHQSHYPAYTTEDRP